MNGAKRLGPGIVAAVVIAGCGDSETATTTAADTSATTTPTSSSSASSTIGTSAGSATAGTATTDPSAGTAGVSGTIVDVVFDTSTLRDAAPGDGKTCRGCDNWPITETADGIQFTSWGDGDGFDGGARASLGVARIEGDKDNYRAFDTFKTGSASGGWPGKSKGLLAIGQDLLMWRSGDGSDASGFALEELYRSTDAGVTWTITAATWYPADFSDGRGFSNHTFCQFGPGYAGGGEFIYVYGFEEQAGDWNVQFPGLVSFMRVPVAGVTDKANYEYFAGLDAGAPTWTQDIEARQPVFEDDQNGVMRLSVVYRAPIAKYVLMVQQNSRTYPGATLGIYQADEPWGPFTGAMPTNPADPKTLGTPIPIISDGNGVEQEATKTVFFGISNKWSDEMPDPTGFVMVYTGDWEDEWGSVEGRFVLAP